MNALLTEILFNPRLTPAAAGLLGALIGVTGTLLVTIVNGLFGRNRFQREKIWERRQAACNEIVGAMRSALPIADRINDGFSEDPHDYYGSTTLEKENEEYWTVIGRADEAFKLNYLILPAAFRKRYERLTIYRHQWDFDAGPDIYIGPINGNSTATDDLMDIALYSLHIVPWWQRGAIRTRMLARGISEKSMAAKREVRTKLKKWRRAKDSSDFEF